LSNTTQPYSLDVWNITLSNTTQSYILDTWNLTLSNTTESYTLDTWNVTLSNISISPYTLDTWNITLSNLTISPYILDTWNVTLGNMSLSTYTLDTWNITLSNTTQLFTLDTWNITLSNTPEATILDTWNITLSNISTYTAIDTWNVTLSNTPLPYTLDTWNLTLSNQTVSAFTVDTWNITLSNISISPYTLDTWNITLSNTTASYNLDKWNITMGNMSITPYILDTWNVTLSNTTKGVILDTWNLTLSNLTISPFIIDTWNITLSNTLLSYTFDTWNITLSNTTQGHVLDTWNITLSNTSLFITNVIATPSEGVVNVTSINITCNVTSPYAIVNATVNMSGTSYNMTNIGDTYYYTAIYNTTGVYSYHIYANDTSGDQNESGIYSFTITELTLSCSFIHEVTGKIVTTVPTITGATYYKWAVEDTSETAWISYDDLCNQQFVLPQGGSYRIILTAKNSIGSVDYTRTVDVGKAPVEIMEPVEVIPEEEEFKLRNVYHDTGVSDWFEGRNAGEFVLIGIVAFSVLLLIFIKRPKKLVIYPVKKKEKQKEK